MFKQLDENADGKLSREEHAAAHSAPTGERKY